MASKVEDERLQWVEKIRSRFLRSEPKNIEKRSKIVEEMVKTRLEYFYKTYVNKNKTNGINQRFRPFKVNNNMNDHLKFITNWKGLQIPKNRDIKESKYADKECFCLY